MPESRVGQDGEDIGQQVETDLGRTEDHAERLHQRNVAVADA